MAAADWKFWADAGLTVPIDPIPFVHAGSGQQDRVIFFGCAVADLQVQAESDAGVDPITLSLTDSAGGSGLAASVVTLALSPGDLDLNTPGDPLDIGVTITSGILGAVTIYQRVSAGATLGHFTDLGIETNPLVESAA